MNENKDKIRVLSDREQSREKLPIFYGSRENYLHGLKEVIGNGIDEINNNFSKGIITVTLLDDMRTISVSDTGRGIPIDGETDGKPNYELLFETLFAGTNYENKDLGKVAVGTNGVGVTVLNYTSEFFRVTSIKNGKRHSITYEGGANIKSDLTSTSADEKQHGTIVTFRLDPLVYTKTVYDPNDLKGILERISATANKITFKFKHKDEETVFHYNNLQQYFEKIVNNLTCKAVIGPETSYNQLLEKDDKERNKICILFATTSEPIHESYLNINWLPEHGTIHDGVISGIRTFVNKYCLEQKLLDKKAPSISTSDVEDSVSYVCSLLSTNVEYANQTKLSTNKVLYRRIASEYVQSLLNVFQVEQPKEFKKFIEHILQVNKFNSRNTAAKAQLKKKLNEKVDNIGGRIEGLVDCAQHGEQSELFVAEGLSALGSLILARDSQIQAAYALRGKILNCLKADYSTIFKNGIILDLIRALGCGIQADKKNKDLESFNEKLLRYGKLIIATDADPDGQQIQCLIITMVYVLVPKLIENGRVYIAKTPLYEVKYEDDSMSYLFSEAEKDEQLPKIKRKYTLARCKGLGELEPETMNYTAMDPKTRILEQITMDDAKKMKDMINMFMGSDITDRKGFIEKNLHKYTETALEE
jgi:DNA gyrase subunit B